MIKSVIKDHLPRTLVILFKTLKRKIDILVFRKRIVTHNYFGYQLSVSIEDQMGQSWYDKEWDQLCEVELLSQGKLRNNARVFELGAHQAVIACILAKIVGENGEVIAVEADPHNYRVGTTNRNLNNLAQLKVLHKAVSDKVGEINFLSGHNGRISHGDSKEVEITVEATTIDQLSEDYGVADVLFIDVEGYEVEVLRGAQQTLSSKPDCFIEVHGGLSDDEYRVSAQQVLPFFPPESYDLYYRLLNNGEFQKLKDPESLPLQRLFIIALSK